MKPRHLTSPTLALAAVVLSYPAAMADSFTDATATGAWNTARWNNSADTAPYTSSYTANNNVQFTSGSYTLNTGIGSGTINIGNVTLSSGVSVAFTGTTAGTFATGGTVRTIDVGTGAIFDTATQGYSSAAGTGFIKNGAGVLALQGGTYTGGFTLNSGTVIVRGVNAMGAGGTLNINGGAIGANASRSMNNTKYTGGIIVGGDFQIGVLSSAVSIALDTANISFDNNVSLGAATRKITIGANGNYTLNGVISGSSGTGLTVDNLSGATGTLFLSGSNTYDGGLNINSGRVELTNAGAAGSANISLQGTDAQLQSSNGITVANNITVSDTGGQKSLRHFNATAGVFSGNITISETTAGNFVANVGASTQLTLSGSISGSGGAGLSKQSTGTLVLSGSSTYSGLLRAGNGTVQLTGTGSMTGISATIGGANNNGTLTLDDNSVFGIDVNGMSATNISSNASGTGTATLNLNGDFSFNLALANLTHGNIWQIVDNASILETYGSSFSVAGFSQVSDVWTKVDGSNTWTFSEATGQLSLAIVPEPGAALLGGLGLVALLRRRR